jgi:hypothetical protein
MQMAIHLLEVDLLSVCGKFHLALDALTRYKIDITNKSLQSSKEKEHEYPLSHSILTQYLGFE